MLLRCRSLVTKQVICRCHVVKGCVIVVVFFNDIYSSAITSSSNVNMAAALLLDYFTGMDKLVCTPASTALFACPGGTVSRLYRHIRQAAIPARVVLGTAVF